MKTNYVTSTIAGLIIVVSGVGCNRQSRSNPEANRAASPAEGGATSTAGSAGESKNYGDTRAKTETEGQSPSASPTGRSKDTTSAHAVDTPAAGASTGQQSQEAQRNPPATQK